MNSIALEELVGGVNHGILAEWLVEPGSVVQEGDPIAEVVTDKANVEVASPYSGKVIELLVEADGRVNIGDVLCTIESD